MLASTALALGAALIAAMVGVAQRAQTHPVFAQPAVVSMAQFGLSALLCFVAALNSNIAMSETAARAAVYSGIVSALVNYSKVAARNYGEASLIGPIEGIAPAITFLYAFTIFDEPVMWQQIFAILLIVLGLSFLNAKNGSPFELLSSLRALRTNRGAQIAFAGVFLSSVTYFWNAQAVRGGNLFAALAAQHAVAAWVCTVIAMLRGDVFVVRKVHGAQVPQVLMTLTGMGIALWMSEALTGLAYTYDNVVSVTAIKRAAAPFSVLLAWWWLGERTHIRARAIGAGIIFAGILLITMKSDLLTTFMLAHKSVPTVD